jgi:hypothetical protein
MPSPTIPTTVATGKLANALANAWSVIQPSDAVRAKAMQLVDRYVCGQPTGCSWQGRSYGVKTSSKAQCF